LHISGSIVETEIMSVPVALCGCGNWTEEHEVRTEIAVRDVLN